MSAIFHENLRNARQRKGMSQQDVADKVGVAKSTYSMWETGNREPNLMKIIALTKVLGVTGDELLGLTPPEETAYHDYEVKYGKERLHAYIEALSKITI